MSCTINVPVSIIAAASHAMAKQDIRYYLNGMMIERSEHGGVRVVATDGQHLIAARANDASIKQRKIQQYILPRDFILAIVKSAKKGANIEIKIAKSGSVSCRSDTVTHHCNVIEGKFPNWKGVIPDDDTILGPTEVNPALMESVNKSYKSLCQHTSLGWRQAGVQFVTRGHSDAIMATYGSEVIGINCLAIVMPMRGREIKSFKEVKV